MKPLYLSIEGINSFIAAREINFSEAADGNIFCICGPTGSGKTTILDAVILSLYGKGDRGVKNDYINVACEKGTIVFRFELDGSEWEVKRVFSRKAGGDKAYLTNVTENDMIADGVEKVNAEMLKLIGLSSNDFTQVVILEQGKFGKFLTAEKTERNKTIAQLFSLDKFDGLFTKFNAVAQKFQNSIDNTDARAEHLKELSPKLLSERKAMLKAAKSELAETEKAIKTLESKVAADALLRERFDRVKAAKTALETAKAEFKAQKAVEKALETKKAELSLAEKAAQSAKAERDKVKEILAKVDAAKETVKRAAELKAKRAELAEKYKINEKKLSDTALKTTAETEKLNGVLQSVKQRFEDIDVSDLNALAARFNAEKTRLGADFAADEINIGVYEKARGKLIAARADFAAADESVPKIKALFEEAEKAESEAKQAYENAVKENAARAVAESLSDGDVCPVCGGVFHGAGAHGGVLSGETKALKTALENATAMREKRAAELKFICNERDRLIKSVSDEAKETESALKKIRCTQNASEIEAAFARVKSEYDGVCFAVSALDRAVQISAEREKLIKEETELRHETDTVTRDGKACKEEIERCEAEINRLVGGDAEAAERDAKERLLSCENAISAYENRREAFNKELEEFRVKKAKTDSDIAHYEKEVISFGEVSFDEKAAEETARAKADADARRGELIAAAAQLEKAVTDAEKGLQELARLDKERKYYEKKRDSAKTLSNLMRGNKFLEYVEGEYIRDFTARASEKLFELSGGKYDLEYSEDDKKSDFWVCDRMRGGEKRKVRTLSGGETFLASLSLAIAISEQIAHNRNYDFFFLDEGFGTLDENAIDVVAAALYKLAGETMVGLVSHRSELVEKIPSRIKVIPATENEGSNIIIEKV